MTMADPLSAGLMMMFLLSFNSFIACLSDLDKLSFIFRVALSLRVSCLSLISRSSISGGYVPGGGVKFDGVLNLMLL